MGQKVNPNGFRVGVNKDWNSTWVPQMKKDMPALIKEDHDIRTHITKNYGTGLNNCSVAKVTIERTPTRTTINIYTGKPGMLIGQKGAGIEKLKRELEKITEKKGFEINVREVKNIDTNADLVAQSVATQLEKRIAWRRAMKMAIQKAMKSGIKGIKIMVGGRLDGADIARSEHYQQGILPLHTLRSDIEYGFAEAHTTFGVIGVKCWVCYGEIKGKTRRTGEVARAKTDRPDRRENRGDYRPRGNGDDRKPRPYNPNFDRRNSNGAQGGYNRQNGNAPQGTRPVARPYNPNNTTRVYTPKPGQTVNANPVVTKPNPEKGGK